MKAILKPGMWKAIAFLTAVIFFSCTACCDDEPTPPVPPVEVLTKAFVAVRPAINVKSESATLVAVVVPNQKITSVTFDYRLTSETTWQSQTLADTFSGSDSITVTLNVNVKLGSDYTVRARAFNKAGEVTSTETSTFLTYAVQDADGNWYHAVTIGTQTWIQENFKGTHFANGDAIPNITNQAAWNTMKTPAMCWYNNDSKNGEVYGGLYNFYVANDPRGLIIGYHSPSRDEFATLSNYLGGNNVAGGKMKEAGYKHWVQPNVGASNSSGFNALPSGARTDSFAHCGDWNIFWSITKNLLGAPTAYTPDLGENSTIFSVDTGGMYFESGLSIRVLKN